MAQRPNKRLSIFRQVTKQNTRTTQTDNSSPQKSQTAFYQRPTNPVIEGKKAAAETAVRIEEKYAVEGLGILGGIIPVIVKENNFD